MKIGVVGSRSIKDDSPVEQALWSSPWFESKGMWPPKKWGYEFVSGGADGVDTSIERFAEDNSIPIEVIEPDYSDWSGDEHPAKRRNTRIVEESDVIIAVWDGHSNGTRDTIDKALDRGVPIYVEVID